MREKRKANRVLRPDGRFINVPRKRGQLFVCATGCCCGHVERGFSPVPTDLYHNEWERRKLRNKVHLSQGGCLGPCPLANVATLFFDGRFVGFQGIDDQRLVREIFDYIEAMLASEDSVAVPLPSLLRERTFDYFAWSDLDAHAMAAVTAAEPDPVLLDDPSILFLSHADTDLLAVSKTRNRLPPEFPPVDAHNLGQFNDLAGRRQLQQHVAAAAVVVARIYGGRAGFREGFEELVNICREGGKELICVPGTADLDAELTAASNVPVPVIHDVHRYLVYGGLANFENLFRYLADNLLIGGFGYELPVEQPRNGIYEGEGASSLEAWLQERHDPARPTAAVLFYRAHWLSGNTAFIDHLTRALTQEDFNVLPVFTYSLKEQNDGRPAVFDLLYTQEGERLPDVLLCTMSFAQGKVNMDGPTHAGWNVESLQELGVPVLQAIASSMEREQWRLSARGLSPLDTAMNVALPEFDGRVITVPFSFKEPAHAADCVCCSPQSPVLEYRVVPDRVRRLAGLARRLADLQRKDNAEKRVAVVLTNQPGRASRVGNAVGLDTPASLIHLMRAMQEAGYCVEGLPADGDTLIHTLIDRCNYDVEFLTESQIAKAVGSVPAELYSRWFAALPADNRREMVARWGEPPGEAYCHEGDLKFAGLILGNIFVALQPPRGYRMDPNAIYHQPDLPPTHHYTAFYHWLREPRDRGGWGADAILHMGKHGTVEWLPGKGIGLSESCYPDRLQGDLPLVYPFIINDPGEGMQTKRRTHAVIVDHLIPAMTRADAYGDLDELQQLVDEYYRLEALDPTKLPLLQGQIWEVMKRANLDKDLEVLAKQTHGDHTHDWDPRETQDGTPVSLAEMSGREFSHLMEDLDGYLCELTGAQIRDGLHIIGEELAGDSLTDLLVALTRLPNLDVPSLRESVAATLGLNLPHLLDQPGARFEEVPRLPGAGPIYSHADAIEFVDNVCRELVEWLGARSFQLPSELDEAPIPSLAHIDGTVSRALAFICDTLVPRLRLSRREEVAQVLNGLAGGYVPAGPSGSPTRGMAHILPTGRNFYAVDPRGVPSQAAWRVGQALAEELLERYGAEEGGYPESVGLSIWGTSAMRTYGDDLAQCLALLGVRPRWHRENRHLTGVEPIPLEELGRPRIDVVMRISGFFRDAFPHLIGLLDEAVQLVAGLDEPPERNFVRKHTLADTARYKEEGSADAEAERRATYRIFGSKPGSYGAGILPLIDTGNWREDTDLAEVYVNWGGYAYAGENYGIDMRPAFRHVLSGVQVAVKNQDNREHDLFDSDDYFQFHGGMVATIRALSGEQPRHFFGDTIDPARVRVRDLKEEANRVFRSRVVNPKWLDSIRRHGYKGGLELAQTVDFLFGYDATAGVVNDWMYGQLAEQYLFDTTMRTFLEGSNPWALQSIGERLLEAMERGLWADPDSEMRARLQEFYLQTEGLLEGREE